MLCQVTISELTNKGRFIGKDSVPTNFHEFAVSTSSESREFKHFVGEVRVVKRVEMGRRRAH